MCFIGFSVLKSISHRMPPKRNHWINRKRIKKRTGHRQRQSKATAATTTSMSKRKEGEMECHSSPPLQTPPLSERDMQEWVAQQFIAKKEAPSVTDESQEEGSTSTERSTKNRKTERTNSEDSLPPLEDINEPQQQQPCVLVGMPMGMPTEARMIRDFKEQQLTTRQQEIVGQWNGTAHLYKNIKGKSSLYNGDWHVEREPDHLFSSGAVFVYIQALEKASGADVIDHFNYVASMLTDDGTDTKTVEHKLKMFLSTLSGPVLQLYGEASKHYPPITPESFVETLRILFLFLIAATWGTNTMMAIMRAMDDAYWHPGHMHPRLGKCHLKAPTKTELTNNRIHGCRIQGLDLGDEIRMPEHVKFMSFTARMLLFEKLLGEAAVLGRTKLKLITNGMMLGLRNMEDVEEPKKKNYLDQPNPQHTEESKEVSDADSIITTCSGKTKEDKATVEQIMEGFEENCSIARSFMPKKKSVERTARCDVDFFNTDYESRLPPKPTAPAKKTHPDEDTPIGTAIEQKEEPTADGSKEPIEETTDAIAPKDSDEASVTSNEMFQAIMNEDIMDFEPMPFTDWDKPTVSKESKRTESTAHSTETSGSDSDPAKDWIEPLDAEMTDAEINSLWNGPIQLDLSWSSEQQSTPTPANTPEPTMPVFAPAQEMTETDDSTLTEHSSDSSSLPSLMPRKDDASSSTSGSEKSTLSQGEKNYRNRLFYGALLAEKRQRHSDS